MILLLRSNKVIVECQFRTHVNELFHHQKNGLPPGWRFEICYSTTKNRRNDFNVVEPERWS